MNGKGSTAYKKLSLKKVKKNNWNKKTLKYSYIKGLTYKMKNKNKTVWSNRFSKGNSRSFQRIGSSINIDKRLYKEDIFASIIHAQMLVKQKIIPKKDGIKIINGLKKIEKR